MKIAIHHTKTSFSERWIEYCDKKGISYKIVNCLDSDIISQLDDCIGLMWHWTLNDYKETLFARQLTLSLEKRGIKVFPDVNTSWHYDDKVGQKYLLEAIGAPLVNSYVFYSKKDAYKWLEHATLPIVFKLRCGAGSLNVRLVKNKQEAYSLINKAFKNGFASINRFSRLKDRIWAMKRDRSFVAMKNIFTGFARIFIPLELEKFSHKEKGYIYFQDFIPNNTYDTRLVVIGNKCIGIRRYCRTGDFRASGSGLIEYDPDFFDPESIKIAFEVAEKLGSQSLAFDFIKDNDKNKIVEISYCYALGKFYDDCPGYWDRNLNWNIADVNPQYFIIEDFIERCR